MLKLSVSDLDLDVTFNCGQCFRWKRDGSRFRGIVGGKEVTAEISGGILTLSSGAAEFWRNYFALDIDYAALKTELCRDARLRRCVENSPGIRVLRQEFFETLISFIISQNNNIPRIRAIIEKLCANFGGAFPAACELAALDERALEPLHAGYRAAYIISAARDVANGKICESELRALPTSAARTKLLSIHGVGPKVAECVLLFGLGRFDAFPMDVWMKRAMAELFPAGLPPQLAPHAGIAQQYIFHFMRTRT